MTLSNPNYPTELLLSNIITLEARAPIYEFGGGHKHSVHFLLPWTWACGVSEGYPSSNTAHPLFLSQIPEPGQGMQGFEPSQEQGAHIELGRDSTGLAGGTGASSERGSEQGQDGWESSDSLGLCPGGSVQAGTSCSLGKGKAVSTC